MNIKNAIHRLFRRKPLQARMIIEIRGYEKGENFDCITNCRRYGKSDAAKVAHGTLVLLDGIYKGSAQKLAQMVVANRLEQKGTENDE